MIKNRGSPTLSAGSTISPVTNISKVSTEISKICTRKSAHAKRASRTRNPRGRWVGRGVAVECYTTTNPTTTTRPHDILPSLSPSTRAHTSSLSLIGGTCAPCLSAFLLSYFSYFLTFLLSYFLTFLLSTCAHTSSLSLIGGTCAPCLSAFLLSYFLSFFLSYFLSFLLSLLSLLSYFLTSTCAHLLSLSYRGHLCRGC